MINLKKLTEFVDQRYLAELLFNNNGANNFYHNSYHGLCVTRSCRDGSLAEHLAESEGAAEVVALGITAILHDIDHAGVMGNDHINIQKALERIHSVILDEHRNLLPIITANMHSTEFLPSGFKIPHDQLTLAQKILRDAEMFQLFEDNYIQQVMLGLGKEFNKSLTEFTKQQLIFVHSIQWQTKWAQGIAAEKMPILIEQLKFLNEIAPV